MLLPAIGPRLVLADATDHILDDSDLTFAIGQGAESLILSARVKRVHVTKADGYALDHLAAVAPSDRGRAVRRRLPGRPLPGSPDTCDPMPRPHRSLRASRQRAAHVSDQIQGVGLEFANPPDPRQKTLALPPRSDLLIATKGGGCFPIASERYTLKGSL